jgi:asparagine synthase (glutamine-hydrolysing)
VFRGASDGEVLPHLYEEYGDAFAERLRGMFAFAVYDARRRLLLLARDRFGIKPLYYWYSDGRIVFASEIKAIAAAPGFRAQLDRQACYDFLGLGYVPEPATAFAGVVALEPGTTATCDASGLRHRRWAELNVEPVSAQRLPDVVDRAANLLDEAVRRQSHADVPIAALLSGGIDSSLVVAAFRRTTGRGLATFNVRFPDSAHDETALALAVARRYGTDHCTIDVGQRLSADGVAELLQQFDQPFADASLIPTYRVCRAIAERGIRCALSGDGGDEAFGGYDTFWRLNVLAGLMRMPVLAQHGLELMGVLLTPWTADVGRQLRRAFRLARLGRSDAATFLAGLGNYLAEGEKRELLQPDAREGCLPVTRLYGPPTAVGADRIEALSQGLTTCDFRIGLRSDMLRKVDIMSMMAGIEVRVPMLDESLVALGLSLPHALKSNRRESKLVLRALAERLLPPEVAAHPKHGFTIPLDRMADVDFHAMLRDLLLSPRARLAGIVNVALAGEWVDAFVAAAEGRGGGRFSRGGLDQRILLLLALELWMRRYALAW